MGTCTDNLSPASEPWQDMGGLLGMAVQPGAALQSLGWEVRGTADPPTDGRKALRSHSHLCSELSMPRELGKQVTFSFSPWHQQSISTSCFPVCSCKMTWFEWFFTQVTHSTDVFSVCVDRDLEPVLHGAILVSAISPVIFMHKLLTLRIIYILITDSQPPLGESSDLFTSSWQASEGFLTQAC